MNATTVYECRAVVPSHVLVRPVAGEMVLLSLESEEYFGLDAVGTRLWELLGSSTNVQEAVNAMGSEYDVEPERLARDVEEFLDVLLSRNLLALVKPGVAGQ